MSSARLAFTSKRRPLGSLPPGCRGVICDIVGAGVDHADRLFALGVTPGAAITVLQTFPGVIFLCDQTELAVERGVAQSILVQPIEGERS